MEFRTGGVGVLDASTGKSSDSDDCERVSKLSIGLIGFISISSFECVVSVCCGRPKRKRQYGSQSECALTSGDRHALELDFEDAETELTAVAVVAEAAAAVAVIVFHISTA